MKRTGMKKEREDVTKQALTIIHECVACKIYPVDKTPKIPGIVPNMFEIPRIIPA
jgi:hypothetical protein